MKVIKVFLYVMLFFIAAVLETIVVPHIEIFGARPSFFLILTVTIALRHGSLAGCFAGFMAGLFCDVYASIEWLGAYSLSYCVVGFAAGQIEENFINLNLIPKIIVLSATELIKDILYFFCISKSSNDIWLSFVSISLPNSVYTITLGAILFYIITPRK